MIKTYNMRFLENGYNTRDPKLLELAVKMGGTPVEICEDREHGSEIKAMHYLFERLTDDELRRVLLVSIKETINFFAKSFQQRYSEFIHAQGLSDKRLELAVKTPRRQSLIIGAKPKNNLYIPQYEPEKSCRHIVLTTRLPFV